MYTTFTRQQLAQRRHEATRLFAQDLSIAEIARRIGVSRPTVSGWRQRFEADPEHGLTLRPTGARARLCAAQRQQLLDALQQGPQAHGYETQLWTLARIAEMIVRLFAVHYHPHYVSQLLHQMGWTCQKPGCRAKERDEAAMARWVTEDWPRIKKGQRSEPPP